MHFKVLGTLQLNFQERVYPHASILLSPFCHACLVTYPIIPPSFPKHMFSGCISLRTYTHPWCIHLEFNLFLFKGKCPKLMVLLMAETHCSSPNCTHSQVFVPGIIPCAHKQWLKETWSAITTMVSQHTRDSILLVQLQSETCVGFTK